MQFIKEVFQGGKKLFNLKLLIGHAVTDSDSLKSLQGNFGPGFFAMNQQVYPTHQVLRDGVI